MNGVFNMLLFVIFGGILMVIVFLFGVDLFKLKSLEYNVFVE